MKSGAHAADISCDTPGRLATDSRGLSMVETMLVLAMASLMLLVIFQMQALVTRQSKVSSGNAQVHRAIRESVTWLGDDVLLARRATVAGGVLTVFLTFGNTERQVEYSLQDQNLIRVLKAGDGSTLQRYLVTTSVTSFTASYDADRALLEYTVAAEAPGGKRLEATGAIRLRNATPGT